ncbi:c-type cytochrome biogenesis protein CcsB [Nakamurella sp. YIM 132084]|uniref:C-type cytochrome biogenesis protein CcsB n=1 Tax=Nakamurella leprariae TaxID=2803911 RepID=A0A938Y584_9ACTN|nr:c-type cytochrome biogenesis protein CcsB [Nakamurella leprariae]
MNEALARWSDLAFEAALAGYVVALACYAIDFAARRGAVPTEAEAASVRIRQAARAGGTTTLEAPGHIGTVQRRTARPMAERFGTAAVVVTVVATAANLLSVLFRGLAVSRLPLANMYEYASAICAIAMVCWLIVLARTKARALGLFVLLPVTILAGVAFSVLYVPAGPVVPALNSYWKWIHVSTVSISSSILLVTGAASVLYLLRSRYERRLVADQRAVTDAAAAPGGGDVFPGSVTSVAADRSLLSRLPSLASLDRIAYRTAIVAFPIYTFALIAGALWAEVAWGRYWGWDPKETCAFVSWVLYAGYLHARATAGWRGRPAAWIAVVGFASIIFNLFFINMVVSGLHSYAGLN